jgi:5,10-methylenetetrahydrofolate reductase
VTVDTIPPKGTDLSRTLCALEGVRNGVDGVNVPDMPGAAMRLGALPVCRVLLDNGYEPIMQIACRDRNRLALQSDLLGAAVMGVENVLVLRGDEVSYSDHPGAKRVNDLDTPQLLAAARGLEMGADLAGHPLQGSPVFFLGATLDPYAPDPAAEIDEMATKWEAGAQFFQTQPVFDVARFRGFLEQASGIRAPVLGGIFLLKSARMARFMNDQVPEVVVPDWVVGRLDAAADAVQESLAIAVETLRALRSLCAGAHIMTIGWENKVPSVLAAAGLAQPQPVNRSLADVTSTN